MTRICDVDKWYRRLSNIRPYSDLRVLARLFAGTFVVTEETISEKEMIARSHLSFADDSTIGTKVKKRLLRKLDIFVIVGNNNNEKRRRERDQCLLSINNH